MELKEIKVKSIKILDVKESVYDINVKDVIISSQRAQ